MLDGKQLHADVLSFDVATVAIKGVREYQEDSLISSFPLGQDTGFAILSDGMGGHTSGHVASALVVAETFSQLKMKDLMLEDGVLNIPATLQEAAKVRSKEDYRKDIRRLQMFLARGSKGEMATRPSVQLSSYYMKKCTNERIQTVESGH